MVSVPVPPGLEYLGYLVPKISITARRSGARQAMSLFVTGKFDSLRIKATLFVLYDCCSDNCLKYFNVSRDEAEKYQDCSTSMFGFNLENGRAKLFIERWLKSAKDGVFNGSRLHDNQSEEFTKNVQPSIYPAIKDFVILLGESDGSKEAIAAAMKTVLGKYSIKMPTLAMPIRYLMFATTQTPAIDPSIHRRLGQNR